MANDKPDMFSSLPSAPQTPRGSAPVPQKPTRLWPAIAAIALLIVGAAVVGVLQSQKKPAGSSTNTPKNAVSQEDALKNLDLANATTTESGLKYIDMKVGEGKEAKPGAQVLVHYVGTFPSGEKFDSSRDRNEFFPFRIGAGQVIKGWDEGVAGMKEGGLRKLIVPPHLGYGPGGSGPIPGNATLVFEVELFKVN